MDYHLHLFKVGRMEFSGGDFATEKGLIDEITVSLSDLYGQKIRYNYDFGDDWWATVIWLKDIDDYDKICPQLLKWTENSPPEDCGGYTDITNCSRHSPIRTMRITSP